MSSTPPNPGPGPGSSPADRDRAAELAELYAAGALSPDERADFDRRIAAGDRDYIAAYRAVLPAIEALLDAPETPPPDRIRAAIDQRLAAEAAERSTLFTDDDRDHDHGRESVRQHPSSRGDIRIVRAASGRWRRTGVPGVRYQPLLADRRANRRTILLEMAPGSTLPEHGHAGIEEVIMLSGDLSIAGTVLNAGDYIQAHPGADHGMPRTENGCVCIVVSAYVPFPLASWPGFVWAAVKGLFTRSPRRDHHR